MKFTTQNDLLKDISNGKINNVYIFFGNDESKKSEIIKVIKSKFLEAELFSFDSKNFDKETFLNDISSNSFFSSKKIIFLKDFNSFKKDAKEFIKNSLKNISNNVVLIINFEGDIKIKEIEEEFSEINTEKFIGVKIEPPLPLEIKNYIKETLSKKGKSIDEKSLEWLSQNIDSYASLKNETEKIINYIGSKKEIKFDEVISLCVSHKESDRFLLINAMLSKNKEEFIKMINELIESGEEPLAILSAIEIGLEKILKISILQKSNIYDNNLIFQIGVFRNEINSFNLRFLNETALIRIIESCLEVENTLKSSITANPYILIRNLSIFISDFLTNF
jgi:DNA polymerase III delta subunit